MKQGQRVTVKDAWGNKLTRAVVSLSERKINVCKPEELKNALLERRSPVSIGFPLEDVTLSGKSSPNSDSRVGLSLEPSSRRSAQHRASGHASLVCAWLLV